MRNFYHNILRVISPLLAWSKVNLAICGFLTRIFLQGPSVLLIKAGPIMIATGYG